MRRKKQLETANSFFVIFFKKEDINVDPIPNVVITTSWINAITFKIICFFEPDSCIKRQNARKSTPAMYSTIAFFKRKSCNSPETINIQVTSNTTYMNENFGQTKNLIWLYLWTSSSFFVRFVAVDGARITISSFTLKKDGKKRRSHSFGKRFPHSFHFAEHFCRIVCCWYLLAIYIVLTHNGTSTFRHCLKHFVRFCTSKWQTYFIHG